METKKKYYGGWSANNGSSYATSYEFTNKATARKEMRSMALGNVFAGNTGWWDVIDDNDVTIFSGTVKNRNRCH